MGFGFMDFFVRQGAKIKNRDPMKGKKYGNGFK